MQRRKIAFYRWHDKRDDKPRFGIGIYPEVMTDEAIKEAVNQMLKGADERLSKQHSFKFESQVDELALLIGEAENIDEVVLHIKRVLCIPPWDK